MSYDNCTYDKHDGFNFHITNCPFLSSNMASLFRSLYDMAGLAPRIDVLWNIWFHRVSATGMASRQGTLTPPDTWSRPFGTCICSTCWDQSFFRTCCYFSGLCSSNFPVYFLDFASFWGRRDFKISFSSSDTLRNSCDRHWGSFMVDTGILSNNMKFPSHES